MAVVAVVVSLIIRRQTFHIKYSEFPFAKTNDQVVSAVFVIEAQESLSELAELTMHRNATEHGVQENIHIHRNTVFAMKRKETRTGTGLIFERYSKKQQTWGDVYVSP